ncbi:sn-glycerol 3-phosphate transport system substrate-binding protein [Gracilibacillus ureilyticus]|uniref:sn-glycerol 3-phosphate transport system substrate-binding protein n=1 Tax=Gracilibacillus ureilyticus TaxID=531814 RepID=A0A1H9TZ44_9BACI|nr:ABC transporter substrate-binding protein [Gracilibacillus ureilyticus]SES02197.1 sn-glycerol 3-phosphate transport system substrate-binding protein [Gracilibacillus ureilyticus]
MKRVKLLVICSCLLFLLTACNSDSSAKEPNESSESNQPVEIEFWYGLGGQVEEVILNQVDRFNESHDNIHVNAVFQDSYDVTSQKLQAAIISGELPDLVQLNTRAWPVFGYNETLLDLNKYIEEDEDINFDDFNKGLLVNTSLDGKQYTLPYNRSTPILYYNKAIMKELGEDPENPVETWDDLVRIAEKASIINDEKVERFGFSASMSGWYFYSLAWSNGGKILGDDLSTVLFDSPEAAEGVALWEEMIDNQLMMPPVGGTSTSGSSAGESLSQSFFNGTTAMTIASTGSLGKFSNNVDFDLGTSFLPRFDEYAVATGGANLAIINNKSKERQDAAWEFIKFMTSTDESIYFSKETGYLPIRLSAQASDELQIYYEEHPIYTKAIDQLEYAREVPKSEHTLRIESEVNKAMEKAVTSDLTAQEALTEAADVIRKLVQ